MYKKVVTAQQMRDIDRRAAEEYGILSIVLMENAGRAVADAAIEMLGGDVQLKRILIVAGHGNNGGDGFVAARHLDNAGADIKIFYFGDRKKAKGDALTNIEIVEKMGLEIDASHDLSKLSSIIKESNLVIDAFLGTGIKGELRPEAAEVVAAINENAGLVLAVDIPSGINADTGEKLGPKLDKQNISQQAIRADETVTFALPKIGLVTYPGRYCAGHLIVVDIGIPEAVLNRDEYNTYLLDSNFSVLIPRQADAHKGTFGHVAVVAGSVGMTGAAALCAEGALRIGAGLVSVAVPESLNDILEVKLTEAMTIPVPEGNARAFGIASLDKVLEIIEKRDVAVIGPGFGRDDDTVEFTLELVRHLAKPTVLDADALFAISKNTDVLKKSNANLIITPHPGEMAMLLGTTVAEVQSKRLEVARRFSAEYGVTVVLKGADTVIAEPDGTSYINTTGTPGMATGGTGDVLAGMIGGLLAQEPVGKASFNVCPAVYIHGIAGELAADKLGQEAMLASDLSAFIGEAVKES